MKEKPRVSNSDSQKEIDKVEKQLESFEQNIKEMNLDRMSEAKKADQEPQTRLSQKELERSKDIYLKPERTIASKEKFNEEYREAYNFDKEYVQFIAENKEIIGEAIEKWTKPYPGLPAEFWRIPTNKPVWGPRYLAEQIKACKYHRFIMQDRPISADGYGQYYGSMAVDTVIQRLDAYPVNSRKSVFTGATNF